MHLDDKMVARLIVEETTFDRASYREEEDESASSREGEDAARRKDAGKNRLRFFVVLPRPARCGTVIGTMAAQLEGKALIFGGNGLSVELKMVVKMPAMMMKIA